MGLGDLLDRIRQLYLDDLRAAAEKAGRKKGTSVVLEPALRDRGGTAVAAGELQLPLRKDLAIVRSGTVREMLTVDSDRMLSFAPITLNWDGGLRVAMGPFHWHAMPLRVPVRRRKSWKPLQDWFWRWFRPDDEADDELLGVVHFLSDPEVSGKVVTFVADLGSAPVAAFEELLDAVAALGVKQCEIGRGE